MVIDCAAECRASKHQISVDCMSAERVPKAQLVSQTEDAGHRYSKREASKPEYRLSDIPLQGMPIQADGVEKPEFVRTQAADFRRLLGVTIHQLFKRTVPTKNFPKSSRLGKRVAVKHVAAVAPLALTGSRLRGSLPFRIA